MATEIKRQGYGQVEPNHLSAPRNGQVYAQLPADDSIDVLENGMFVHYNYAEGKCQFTGDGPVMMVYNEEKLYDERHQMHKDFAQKKEDSYDGVIVPRVFALSVGDIWTTNTVKDATYNAKDKLKIGTTGLLEAGDAGAGEPIIQVVKETTLPDGQKALKLQVIGIGAGAGA